MDMLTIFGKPTSINVRKVLWTCAEIGMPFSHEEQAPAFAANPNGLVPAILDDGAVLWESNTICRYLAAKHGRDDLLPAEPLARAHVEKWMDWQAQELNNAWRYAFMARVRQSPAHTDEAAIAASIAGWNHHMGLLDVALQKTGAYITGEHFTVADVVLGLSANRWLSTPMERPALPAVDAYVARLERHPACLTYCRNGTP
jgi:glutathione S-transferase